MSFRYPGYILDITQASRAFLQIRFKFVDEEGDAVFISSDEDLLDAIRMSRKSQDSGNEVVKLSAEEVEDNSMPDPMLLAAAGVGVALIGIVAMIMLRPSRR